MVKPVMLPKIGWLGMPKCRNSIWLAQWCRSNGAEIEVDDIIAVIHTPWAQLKIAAPVSGFLFWMKKTIAGSICRMCPALLSMPCNPWHALNPMGMGQPCDPEFQGDRKDLTTRDNGVQIEWIAENVYGADDNPI